MISKHAIAYLFSHGVPALVSFISIAVFTRLLTPEQYGIYVLVFAVAAMLNSIVFEWLKQGLLRFYPKLGEQPSFIHTLKLSFVACILLTAAVGSVVYFLIEDIDLLYLILCLVLAWSQSWNGMNLTLMRAKLQPLSYGYLAFSRAILTLGISIVLITVVGLGETGLLLGWIIALIITTLYPTMVHWRGNKASDNSFNPDYFKKIFSYGFPLTITFLMAIIIHNSDRLMIQFFMGEAATGVYSATYDLTEQTIYTIMMIINLAAFPIVIKTMEQEGESQAFHQIKRNTSLVLMVAFPAVAGFILLSEHIVTFLLGADFRKEALMLIPFIAIGAFLKGFKIYCVDIVLQVKQRTKIQIIPVAVGAVSNILFNFWLIPQFGLLGAAYSSIIAYILAVATSWVLVSIYISALPFPWRDFYKITLATLTMIAVIWPLSSTVGLISLIVLSVLGALIYVLILYLLNGLDIRNWVKKKTKAIHR
ncbi:lipopolysaccharide biosynthesis protein [Alkalihalobacillus trypoxylicola]|uniref:Uncharacterized protein n=1 Tax=Alkalihalobacillus trypoxylicola TaxID=519424 RepID=A0A162DUJ2_9BACI|nr:oligosaccharide flippase family protein [Alkalihalobacillus trypoxylicola]KYG30876.1 hypothetical protein AZF04_18700 [Alkalihalobacillus trypoxylicola]